MIKYPTTKKLWDDFIIETPHDSEHMSMSCAERNILNQRIKYLENKIGMLMYEHELSENDIIS